MHKKLCLFLDTKEIEYIVKKLFKATHLHKSSRNKARSAKRKHMEGSNRFLLVDY